MYRLLPFRCQQLVECLQVAKRWEVSHSVPGNDYKPQKHHADRHDGPYINQPPRPFDHGLISIKSRNAAASPDFTLPSKDHEGLITAQNPVLPWPGQLKLRSKRVDIKPPKGRLPIYIDSFQFRRPTWDSIASPGDSGTSLSMSRYIQVSDQNTVPACRVCQATNGSLAESDAKLGATVKRHRWLAPACETCDAQSTYTALLSSRYLISGLCCCMRYIHWAVPLP